MQFFDLNRQFNLSEILTPNLTLDQLSQHDWFLAKIRVDHDCLNDSELVEGQAIIRSNHNVEITLEWLIVDSGYDLQVQFKGIELEALAPTIISVNGAQLVDENQKKISIESLSLWIDNTLLHLIPSIRREIKMRLNLWDYVDYD